MVKSFLVRVSEVQSISTIKNTLISSALQRLLEHLTQSDKWHSDWTLGSISFPLSLVEDSSLLKQIVAFSCGSAEVCTLELTARDQDEAAVTFCR